MAFKAVDLKESSVDGNMARLNNGHLIALLGPVVVMEG
jgi:hypothetical protein